MNNNMIGRINAATGKVVKSDDQMYDLDNPYKDEIFLLELPKGGDIEELRAVGFTGWPATMTNKETMPIRFYAKVIAFEDINAPERNWQVETDKIIVKKAKKSSALEKELKKLL